MAKDKLQNELETMKNMMGDSNKDLANYKESNANL